MILFRRWRRDSARNGVWFPSEQLIITFFAGSCAGIIAWVANMQYFTSFFKSNDDNSSQMRHVFEIGGGAATWHAVFLVLYSLEHICLIAAVSSIKRQLLRNLQSESESDCKLANLSNISIIFSFCCGLTGLTGNFLCAQWRVDLFYLSSDVVTAIPNNGTVSISDIVQQFNDKATAFAHSSSIQPFCEAFALVLNACAFTSVINATIRRQVMLVPSLANRYLDAKSIYLMKFLRAAVLLLLLPRASYAAFQATTSLLQSNNYSCTGSCNSSCMNNFALLRSWLEFTPEFHALIIFASSPLLMIIIILSMTIMARREIAQQLLHHVVSRLLLPDHSASPFRSHESGIGSQVTSADLDISSSTFVHSKDTAVGEPLRCRSRFSPCSNIHYHLKP